MPEIWRMKLVNPAVLAAVREVIASGVSRARRRWPLYVARLAILL